MVKNQFNYFANINFKTIDLKSFNYFEQNLIHLINAFEQNHSCVKIISKLTNDKYPEKVWNLEYSNGDFIERELYQKTNNKYSLRSISKKIIKNLEQNYESSDIDGFFLVVGNKRLDLWDFIWLLDLPNYSSYNRDDLFKINFTEFLDKLEVHYEKQILNENIGLVRDLDRNYIQKL